MLEFGTKVHCCRLSCWDHIPPVCLVLAMPPHRCRKHTAWCDFPCGGVIWRLYVLAIEDKHNASGVRGIFVC